MLSEVEVDELVDKADEQIYEIAQASGVWTYVWKGRIGVQIDGHLVADQLRAMADVLDQAEEEMKR